MEVMVVADGPMVKYHGNKLRQYILTLMNIVSAFNMPSRDTEITIGRSFSQVSLIYRDQSLGNSVRISAVKLIILDESESFAPKHQVIVKHSVLQSHT